MSPKTADRDALMAATPPKIGVRRSLEFLSPTHQQMASASSDPTTYGSYTAGGNPMQGKPIDTMTGVRERIIVQDGVQARERVVMHADISQQSQDMITHLEMLNQEALLRAKYALDHQNHRFHVEAHEFQQEARDIAQSEVAKAQVDVEANYHSALNYTRRAAEAALDSQRQALIHEAESAINQQRSAIVQEAEAYVKEQHDHTDGLLRSELSEAESHLFRKETELWGK